MTAPLPDCDTLPTDLLRQSAEWRLLALLFEPPSKTWHRAVQALGESQSDDVLREAAQRAQREAAAGLYHSIFGPGGPASPREVSYHRCTLPGGMVSEIEAYYAAFGYAPRCDEPPDHVAVEAGFVAYLRFKEAYAVTRSEREQAAVAAEAAERFVSEHLAVLAEPLESALRRSGMGYLTLAAKALRERTGPSPSGSQASPLPILTDEDALANKKESTS